ncbi:MAG: cytochrome C [Pirellula sp.]|nr:cytochrome C [Pirellula sp.]
MASSRSSLLLAALLVSACGWFAARAAEPVAAPATATNHSATPNPADLLKQDFKANLPRVAPTEPGDVMKDFTVAPGFQLEQVAAEPLVNSPVAMEWDENGRLFVCEMRGYSENRDDGISRVSMLEDLDGDGRYDKSTVFVDKLLWPTAVFCYDGGVFIGDAPDVRYYKDVDGDGRADVVQNVFTGFGTSNVQGLLNCFRWGLDNRIHLATSSIGGDIRRADPAKAKFWPVDDKDRAAHHEADFKDSKPVNVRGRDIAFNPKTYEFLLTSGASQHGMSFDDWGHKFVSSNSNHIQQVMYEDRYVARNPYLSAPDARLTIAADGPQAEVFRTSPVEPWRVIRTQLRVSGAVKGSVEGGGRAAGYFTGAGGVTIYRGDAWPAKWHGIAVVGDVGSNLVHRKRLERNPASPLEFIARRIDTESEFVSSKDLWFRPCQYANGPDGTLHILDVYREVIEHPASIPPMIKQHLDLTAGKDRGRLYRILPDGYKHRPCPKLGSATTPELVALLEHPNSWHRETAARLLYQKQDKAAVEPLKKLVAESKLPQGRIHALYALDGTGMSAFDESTISRGLADEHPQVRKHAIWLSEKWALTDLTYYQLTQLSNDLNLEVRYQLAFSLGDRRACKLRDTDNWVAKRQRSIDASKALIKVLTHDSDDRWMQLAVQSSLTDNLSYEFQQLTEDASYRSSVGGRQVIERLAAQIGLQNNPDDIATVVETLDELPLTETSLSLAITRGLMQGLKKSNSEISKLAAAGKLAKMQSIVDTMLAKSTATAVDEKAAVKARLAAIDTLGMGKFADLQPTLKKLIDNRQPTEVQLAALATLGKFPDVGTADVVLAAWPGLSPQVREPALEVLFARPERIVKLLDAVEAKKFAPGDIPPARVQALTRGGGSAATKERVAKLLGSQMLGRRADVIAAYREALTIKGDVEMGRLHFKKNCSSCHKAEGFGHEIGPNLASIKTRGPDAILTNVLDPSREVNPQFVNYTAVTDDGRTITGLIGAESATAVTLRRAEGQQDTILRVNLEELASTGLSLMPEGLEKQLDKQALADVIAYLMQLQ